MSTDETLTDSQLQLVPAYGSSSDNMSEGESSRTALYDDLVKNPDYFWDKLLDFLEEIGKTPTESGSASAFRGGHKSRWSSNEEDVKRLVEKGVQNKGNQVLLTGSRIEGIIHGKFDSGYFVTIKMGSQELKGVLYHPSPETPRRCKKKAKLSHGGSLRPKFPRSGYNFFFSEEYKRLKAAYAGQERSLIKEIGNKWTNLSPSDREIYQGKGPEDMARYKRELAAYKSVIDSGVEGNVAVATDDAAAEVEAEAEADL
ncbi:hypothetical protein Bca101_010707 [Brassica carinata]